MAMRNLEEVAQDTHTAKVAYQEAYDAYIKALPGRDLTIKQGHMHTCKQVFITALQNFFDEYEKSGVL